MKASVHEWLEDLPCRVRHVDVNDSVVVLAGDAWSLAVTCPWRGLLSGVEMSWLDPGIEDWLWHAVGEELTSVDFSSPASVRFTFTNGWLEVEPDTDLDPWVLRLPAGVLVGGMQHPA